MPDPDVTAAPTVDRRRIVIIAVIAVLCIGGAVAYVIGASSRTSRELAAPDPGVVRAIDALPDPTLVFLDDTGDTYRRVSAQSLDAMLAAAPVAPTDTPDPRLTTDIRCQRIYTAADRTLCVEATQFSGNAYILDADLNLLHQFTLNGIPSRARISPDGRYGSMTVFVTGHSYAEGGFSTATVLVDMATGEQIGNIQDIFEVYLDGERIQSVDFNFWGVTFVPDTETFYATLGTGTNTYLVKADLDTRRMEVLRDNVECPSLSPDGTRLVFKKRISGDGMFESVRWRLHLLDLATMEETPLPDTRSVDDQVEWIDDQHLVYSVRDEGPPATIRPDLWMLPLDGEPERIAVGASSPVVVRDAE